MSEYQRYEFMTSDAPLTRAQLDEVSHLSSHIEASSTHALIEYHWGDFKHDPLDVLLRYFDGFLYWANWGAPQLAFRFPHGVAPGNLLDDYDFEEFVTLIQHPDFDILDIHFGEMEGPDEWTEYELGSLMPLREEIMNGDLRALYLVWLAAHHLLGDADEEEEYDIRTPPVAPGLGALTSAQQALADLLQIPPELIGAAALHSAPIARAPSEDFAAWIELLPAERRADYLLRLARNEPGLSQQLVRELRALRPDKGSDAPPASAQVTYATLLAESRVVKAQIERERQERKRQAQEQRLRTIHERQADYWQRASAAVERGSGAGYDEAVQLVLALRDAATRFDTIAQFEARFRAWLLPHLKRPALVKRLQEQRLTLPEA